MILNSKEENPKLKSKLRSN